MKFVALLLAPLGFLLRRKRAGRAQSIRHQLGIAADERPTLALTSASFEDGGTMPLKHATMDLGPNVAPPLEWTQVPPGTAQLLLVMEDPDVLIARPGRHMIALFGIEPPHIAEGDLTTDNPRFTFLPGSRGNVGYHGPRPLPGHGEHRYDFYLFALDAEVPVGPETTVDEILPTLVGHVLAWGHLEGRLSG